MNNKIVKVLGKVLSLAMIISCANMPSIKAETVQNSTVLRYEAENYADGVTSSNASGNKYALIGESGIEFKEINASNIGNYQLCLRCSVPEATALETKTLKVNVNGTDFTQEITVGNEWKTEEIRVSGVKLHRNSITFPKEAGVNEGIAIDYIELNNAYRIEAESSVKNATPETLATAEGYVTFVRASAEGEDGIDFAFNNLSAGKYTVKVSYSKYDYWNDASVLINGDNITYITTKSDKPLWYTKASDSYKEGENDTPVFAVKEIRNVDLLDGTNILNIYGEKDQVLIDYVEIVPEIDGVSVYDYSQEKLHIEVESYTTSEIYKGQYTDIDGNTCDALHVRMGGNDTPSYKILTDAGKYNIAVRYHNYQYDKSLIIKLNNTEIYNKNPGLTTGWESSTTTKNGYVYLNNIEFNSGVNVLTISSNGDQMLGDYIEISSTEKFVSYNKGLVFEAEDATALGSGIGSITYTNGNTASGQKGGAEFEVEADAGYYIMNVIGGENTDIWPYVQFTVNDTAENRVYFDSAVKKYTVYGKESLVELKQGTNKIKVEWFSNATATSVNNNYVIDKIEILTPTEIPANGLLEMNAADRISHRAKTITDTQTRYTILPQNVSLGYVLYASEAGEYDLSIEAVSCYWGNYKISVNRGEAVQIYPAGIENNKFPTSATETYFDDKAKTTKINLKKGINTIEIVDNTKNLFLGDIVLEKCEEPIPEEPIIPDREEPYGYCSIEYLDADGNDAPEAEAVTIKGVCTPINCESINPVFIGAIYDKQDRLVKVAIDEIMENDKLEYTLENFGTALSDGGRLGVFLWEGFDTLIPIEISRNTKIETITDNVILGGGGFVSGIATHPTDSSVVYCRSDISGVYKLDSNGKWNQLLDGLTYGNDVLMGVRGIALDYNDSDVIYVAAGRSNSVNGRTGDILKSVDGGETWTETGLNKTFYSLSDQRAYGDCVQVDPLNSNILYVITPTEGLYKSTDAAATWEKVDSFNYDVENLGAWVAFGKNATDENQSSVIYVCVPTVGIYVSNDAGSTWSLIDNSPLDVKNVAINSDGVLYTAGGTGIYKYSSNTWTLLKSSSSCGYSGIDIDPTNEDRLIAVTGQKHNSTDGLGNNHVLISNDGGVTWDDTLDGTVYTNTTGYVYGGKITNSSAIKFNRANTAQAFVADWFGVYKTENIDSNAVVWARTEGIENTLVYTVKALTGENTVMVGMADIASILFEDAKSAGSQVSVGLQHITDIDFCEEDSDIIVEVGTENSSDGDVNCAYTLDGGDSWQYISGNMPKSNNASHSGTAHVAVSAKKGTNGYPTILASAESGAGLNYSEDMGATWNQCVGIPNSFGMGLYYYTQPLASDRINGDYFYVYYGGKLYVSNNGGKNFVAVSANGLPVGSHLSVQVISSPYNAGELYICFGNGSGIFRSTDYGQNFNKITGIERPIRIAVGKKADDSNYATLFAYNSEDSGLYRSTDNGLNWVKVSDDKNCFATINTMEGDRKTFGRVYVGTNGRGVFCIDEAN